MFNFLDKSLQQENKMNLFTSEFLFSNSKLNNHVWLWGLGKYSLGRQPKHMLIFSPTHLSQKARLNMI